MKRIFVSLLVIVSLVMLVGCYDDIIDAVSSVQPANPNKFN